MHRLQKYLLILVAAVLCVATPSTIIPVFGAENSAQAAANIEVIVDHRTSDTIMLTWTQTRTFMSYTIIQNGVEIDTTNKQEYIVQNVHAHENYTFEVRGNAADKSSSLVSNKVEAIALSGVNPPRKPTGFSVSKTTDVSVFLVWDQHEEADIRYDIYRNGERIKSTQSLFYTDRDVTPETEYTYTLQTRRLGAEVSEMSDPITVKTTTTVPIPMDFYVESVTHSSVQLRWDRGVEPEVRYDIFRDGKKIKSTQAKSFLDAKVSPNTDYTYTLRSRRLNGEVSEFTIPVATKTENKIMLAPTGLKAKEITKTTVELAWDAYDEWNIQYVVYRDGQQVAITDKPTFMDESLQPVTNYEYSIKAQRTNGDSSDNSAVLPIYTKAPLTPTGAIASDITQTGVTLKWNVNEEEDIKYLIYQDGKRVNSKYNPKAIITDLQPNQTYRFTIRAQFVGTNVISDPSNEVVIQTLPLYASVKGLKVEEATTTSIAMSWLAHSESEMTYILYRQGIEVGQTTSTTFKDSGLVSGTQYEYTIQGMKADGSRSELSEILLAETKKDVPQPPTGLKSGNITQTSAELSWYEAPEKEVKYLIFKDGQLIDEQYHNKANIQNLFPNTAYRFTVKAESIENGTISEATNEVIIHTNPLFVKVTGIQSGEVTDSSIILTWDTHPEQNIEYIIYRNGLEIGRTSNTTWLDSALVSQTEYEYHVMVLNASQDRSELSEPFIEKTKAAALTQPTELQAIGVTDTSISLRWNPNPEDNVSYDIYRDNIKIKTVDAAQFEDQNLRPQTEYTYYVIATNISNPSSLPSTPLKVTTSSNVQHPELVGKNNMFMNGYWEKYGLIVNAKIDLPESDLADQRITEKQLVLLEDNKVVVAVPVVLTDWFTYGKQNSYQGIITNKMFESLAQGNYTLALQYKSVDDLVTIPLEEEKSTYFNRIFNVKTNFEKLGYYIFSNSSFMPQINDNITHLAVGATTDPYIYTLNGYGIQDEAIFDGYIGNNNYDFSQPHVKRLVIRNQAGEVIKIVENLPTLDVSLWNLDFQNGHDLSGFQLKLDPEYLVEGYTYEVQVLENDAVIISALST